MLLLSTAYSEVMVQIPSREVGDIMKVKVVTNQLHC